MSNHPTVALLTLGCAKNLVDSERLASALEAAGARVTSDVSEAQVAVINTCGFIESAKQESIDAILGVAATKNHEGLHTIIVTGCLSERYGEELRGLLPEVDAFVGIDPEGAARLALRAVGLSAAPLPSGAVLRAHRLTPPAWGYLRISEGCDNRCAYCAIPLIRGPLRSRPMAELVVEARFLVDSGARELNIIAQDAAAYGMDLDGRQTLHRLLPEICRIQGIEWVRLLYVHPAHVYDGLLAVMAAEPKICPYVDMPLQHISDRVLARMGRNMDRRGTEELVARVRERIPGLTLRTTFLVGFPGETDAEFEELLEFVAAARFERVGCFAYSREEGTPAAAFEDHVAPEVAEERCDALMRAQMEIGFEWARARIGHRDRVLLEEETTPEGHRVARGRSEAPDVDPVVLVQNGEGLAAGDFVDVEIVGAAGYDCIARVVGEER